MAVWTSEKPERLGSGSGWSGRLAGDSGLRHDDLIDVGEVGSGGGEADGIGELLFSAIFTVRVAHVVQEPVGGKVMLVVEPLIVSVPVREDATPSA